MKRPVQFICINLSHANKYCFTVHDNPLTLLPIRSSVCSSKRGRFCSSQLIAIIFNWADRKIGYCYLHCTYISDNNNITTLMIDTCSFVKELNN